MISHIGQRLPLAGPPHPICRCLSQPPTPEKEVSCTLYLELFFFISYPLLIVACEAIKAKKDHKKRQRIFGEKKPPHRPRPPPLPRAARPTVRD